MSMDDNAPREAEAEWVVPIDGPGAEETESPADGIGRPRFRKANVVAPVLAALLVGAGAAYAVEHHSSTPTASAGGVVNAASSGDGRSGLGGVSGEQHVQGTMIAKSGSTITVKATDGTTAAYVVDSSTEIVRDGQPASLSDIAVGDPVFVHVYPSSGQMLVERLFAGSSATDGGGPGFGSPPSSGGTTTTPATHI
jgi:hypothetical protein